MPIEIICETCGKPFKVKPSKAHYRSCSHACRVGRTVRLTKVCAHCGVEFTRPNHKVWQDAKYCSFDCYNGARRALPPEERTALMMKATAEISGRRRSHEDRCRRAIGVMKACRLSDDELEILAAFHEAGLRPIPLYAVGIFNVDFAFPDLKLAVEYNGGCWHNTRKKRRQDGEKYRHLHEHGWRILVFPMLDKPRLWKNGAKKIKLPALVARVERAAHR